MQGFFGVPPGIQATTGNVLDPAEVRRREQDLRASIAGARATVPQAAANLTHWLDGNAAVRTMPTQPFLDPLSRLGEFLQRQALPAITRGIAQRLADTNHPQGSLQPPGTRRFLQYRDGIRPLVTSGGVGTDLAIAVGGYCIHSAVWVSARPNPTTTGGIMGIGATRTWTVDVLRWCVQIYDVYDWNLGAITTVGVPNQLLRGFPLPPGAYTIYGSTNRGTILNLHDNWFRDLEASGVGKAYVIRTDPFPAPGIPATLSVSA